MKYKIISLLCLLAFFTACSNDDPMPKPEPPTQGTRTVLVYIAGENSLAGLVQADINEMKKGMANVDVTYNNLLVYIDDRSTPRLILLTKDQNQNVTEETVAEYSEQNSLDVAVMKNIFATAFSKYPAESYGLVLWSHGEGWIPVASTKSSSRWWGVDNGANSSSNAGAKMDINELHEALQSTHHFKYILFDSCFMEAVEIAYELRDCCDYLIGSPTEIPGPGAPYDYVVPALFDRDDAAMSIAKNYFEPYEATYNGGNDNSNTNWTAGVSIAVLKSSELENLAAATAKVLPKYIQNKENPYYSGVICYDNRSSKYYHDLERFIHSLTRGNSDYTTWKAAFDKAMIYWNTTATNFSAFGSGKITMDPDAGGLSTFIPRSTQTDLLDFYHTLEWYTAAGWNQTGW